MKYLCLIYEEEKRFTQVSKPELDKVMSEYGALTEDLKKNGQYVAGFQLQPTDAATTVRSRHGKVSRPMDRSQRPRNSSAEHTSSKPRILTRRSRSPREFLPPGLARSKYVRS